MKKQLPHLLLLALMISLAVGAAAQSGAGAPPAQNAPAGQSTGATAQAGGADQAQNTLCRVFFLKPKAGAMRQFEAGLKQHAGWHRQNDKWEWHIAQVVTGPSTGEYVASTCGHNWADFDLAEKLTASHQANVEATVGPHTEKMENGIYRVRTDLSSNGPPPQGTSMWIVNVFWIKPGHAPAFADAVRRTRDIMMKTNPAPYAMWLQLVNGGEPVFVVLTARTNWADFSRFPGPRVAVEQALGAEQAKAHWKNFDDAVLRSHSEIVKDRPDLAGAATGAATQKR